MRLSEIGEYKPYRETEFTWTANNTYARFLEVKSGSQFEIYPLTMIKLWSQG